MVKLSRLNGGTLVVNLELIATLEALPDTVVTLVNGDKFLVKDRVDDIIRKAVEYRHSMLVEGPPVVTTNVQDDV